MTQHDVDQAANFLFTVFWILVIIGSWTWAIIDTRNENSEGTPAVAAVIVSILTILFVFFSWYYSLPVKGIQ